jgi:hypothetical protein
MKRKSSFKNWKSSYFNNIVKRVGFFRIIEKVKFLITSGEKRKLGNGR